MEEMSEALKSKMAPSVLFFFTLILGAHASSLLDAYQSTLKESDEQLLSLVVGAGLKREYDFIVIGGGTAGCTVASRLSEISKWSVLLLEAGGPEHFFMDVPVLVGNLQNGNYDWQFKTEPSDSYCLGYENHQCHIPRGKVLGGSSVLNYMLATRGNRMDYDTWRNIGNPGWSYDEVLPYFIKAENMTIPELRDGPLHGKNGPLSISHSQYHTKLADAFLEAGRELGHNIGDYNGAQQNSFSYFQFTKKNGRRASNPRSYIYPILKERTNLHVRVNAVVRKIIMERNMAVGVEVEYEGQNQRAYAKREVILSAGAIGSPQILMLSGIGPKKHLESLGIQTVRDLPVGDNFQDHVSLTGLFFTTNLTDADLKGENIANDPKNFIDYVERGFGPYEVPGGNEAVFFYDIDNPNGPGANPDIEMHFSSVSPIPEQQVRGFTTKLYDQVFKPFDDVISWAVQPIIMHPKSRGTVRLTSKDIHAKPKLTPNYFSDPSDIAVIIKGIEKLLEISNTKAFQKFNSQLNPLNVPGCEGLVPKTNEYWTCLLRVLTISNYHQVGTCKMAADGVVDPRLRVWNVLRLRVIDASIMPFVPAAHTNIPTNMIAEKGADMIKQDHGRRT